MVLYFSGTGNSRHVAQMLNDPRTADIKDCLKQKKCGFHLKKGESFGIVCPVYYEGIPKTVLEFVRHMKISGEITYLYCIFTHGGGCLATGSMLENELNKRGYPLHACFDIKMARNYIMFGPLQEESLDREQLIEAEDKIQLVKNAVEQREHSKPEWTRRERRITHSMYPLCDRYMSVRRFYADERCVGCGLCAKRCPSGCIEMIDGRPVWNKNKCVRCMACLQCNAVQFGKNSKNYRRYSYEKIMK